MCIRDRLYEVPGGSQVDGLPPAPSRKVCGPSSVSRPSSDLWVEQANAPDHSELISCANQLCSCP
eukprot:4038786-Pyramimonas_sp.AAC.1